MRDLDSSDSSDEPPDLDDVVPLAEEPSDDEEPVTGRTFPGVDPEEEEA